jgi:hypothetical protein
MQSFHKKGERKKVLLPGLLVEGRPGKCNVWKEGPFVEGVAVLFKPVCKCILVVIEGRGCVEPFYGKGHYMVFFGWKKEEFVADSCGPNEKGGRGA